MNKKTKILAFLFFVSFLLGGNAVALNTEPYNIPDIDAFLSDGTYFNGYTELSSSYDFNGIWEYTAIATEAGHRNVSLTGGTQTFDNTDLSNWGIFSQVNFDTTNLYFQDLGDNDPPAPGEGVDPFNYPDPWFKVFTLDEASNVLGYLNGDPTLVLGQGTYIIGFGDYGGSFDGDYDDLILALKPASPVPEPATMLLLGTGLFVLAGFGRKLRR